jgi:hypothetical protein
LGNALREITANDFKGAIMNELPKEGQAMDFKGSALVCVAANKEEIYEVLKSDIYTENDVWDFSNVCYSRTSTSRLTSAGILE